MSESDRDSKAVRRAAGVVLGSLAAAGALIGGAIAAQPAQAAQPDRADAHEPAVIPAPPSIGDQFRDAFAPGRADLAKLPAVVISEG
jgi:hypothetical protein